MRSNGLDSQYRVSIGRGRSYQAPSRSLNGRHARAEVRDVVGCRQAVGHRELVVEPVLEALEAGREVEDRPAVLNGADPTGDDRAPVADAFDLVDDRDRRVAGAQEVGVEGVDGRTSVGHGPGRRHQRLAGDLATEHPLAVVVRARAAEDVDLDRLEVQDLHQVVDRFLVHRLAPCRRSVVGSGQSLSG